MISRLLVGCVIGLLAGAAVAAGLVFGLHTTVFDGSLGIVLAYATAAVTGVLTGLVAGKPIWAHGASIEAGLKAVFGAMLGTVAMFALRKWASGIHPPDWTALGLGGAGGLGDQPASSLPLLGAVLGGLFELDNTGDGPKEGAGVRGRSGSGGVRVDTGKAANAGARRTPSSAEGAPDDDESERKRATKG
jgi:hypothetical protein